MPSTASSSGRVLPFKPSVLDQHAVALVSSVFIEIYSLVFVTGLTRNFDTLTCGPECTG